MATGYGYVRDKEPLSINWAEISKGFNDRLKKQKDKAKEMIYRNNMMNYLNS
jgi:hypothetical protein